jgi:hypothetical protein
MCGWVARKDARFNCGGMSRICHSAWGTLCRVQVIRAQASSRPGRFIANIDRLWSKFGMLPRNSVSTNCTNDEHRCKVGDDRHLVQFRTTPRPLDCLDSDLGA